MKNNRDPLKRLACVANYLDSTDDVIATDIVREFDKAAEEDLQKLEHVFSRVKLRRALARRPEWHPCNGWCAKLLGQHGDQRDAPVLERIVLQSSDDFRRGLDDAMLGYLLLTGEQGLDVVDERFLRNRDAPFSDMHAAFRAVCNLWTNSHNRIASTRLHQSVRLLLDRPVMVDLAIGELIRMEDWSVCERLRTMYEKDDYDDPKTRTAIRYAIVRYLLAASEVTTAASDDADSPDVPANAEIASTAARAGELLQELDQTHPEAAEVIATWRTVSAKLGAGQLEFELQAP